MGDDAQTVCARRFPRLAEYLATVPGGLDAYPDARSKSTLLRSALEGHEDLCAEGLPLDVAELFRNPPPPTVWIPAVHVNAVFHAICDQYYPTERNVIAWARRRTRSMANNPIYRRLLSFTGPRALLKIAGRVDRMFQRGTHIDAEYGPGWAESRLRHPPHLVSPLNQVANVGMFEAMVEMTGADDPLCEMSDASPTGALFRTTWRE
ncbi:MAG: hypothetical protein RLO52_16650 [Sandaracinaceae bacterium]|nr:hypothetical protein [Myxococcales bacterium]